MTVKKCRITFPGKMELYALAFNRYMSSGMTVQFHYQVLKKLVLEDAKNIDTKLGRDVVCKIKEEGREFLIWVRRKIDE